MACFRGPLRNWWGFSSPLEGCIGPMSRPSGQNVIFKTYRKENMGCSSTHPPPPAPRAKVRDGGSHRLLSESFGHEHPAVMSRRCDLQKGSQEFGGISMSTNKSSHIFWEKSMSTKKGFEKKWGTSMSPKKRLPGVWGEHMEDQSLCSTQRHKKRKGKLKSQTIIEVSRPGGEHR